MKELDITTNTIYFVFIIVIILIAIIYISQNKTPGTTIENFEPTTTQSAIPTKNQSTLTGKNDDITNPIIKQTLTELKNAMSRFSDLDAPIVMNDDGNICSAWGDYNNGQYRMNDNMCIVLDGNRKCLSGNNILTTCDNIYKDDYINKMNVIDIQPLLDSTKVEIMNNQQGIKADIEVKSKNMDEKINELMVKKELEAQQKFFINNNQMYLEDKKKNISRIEKELDKQYNDVSINQTGFSQFLQDNTSNENINAIYRKALWILIIAIIVVCVLNFLFSDILY